MITALARLHHPGLGVDMPSLHCLSQMMLCSSRRQLQEAQVNLARCIALGSCLLLTSCHTLMLFFLKQDTSILPCANCKTADSMMPS